MSRADTRRPFTRRGPPTEEEERERLREAREAEERRRAQELPPARSIPRTPFDRSAPTINPPREARPIHPTINPPRGRDNGPRTQAELTAADEARKRARAQQRGLDEQNRLDENQRRAEQGLPPIPPPAPDRPTADGDIEARRRQQQEVRDFNRAEAQRKAEDRRKAMGLPETSAQRREDVRTRAARHALLDGNTERIPRLQGSLESATRRGQANPDIIPHNQIVRARVKGRETFQRWSAITREFTPVTIDPLTGKIGIDTSDQAALSDAAVDDSFNTRITALRGLAADPDLDPNSAKQLEFIATGLEAIQEGVSEIGRDEALKLADKQYSKAAAFIKTEEEEIPSVLRGLNEAVTPVEGFPGWFWTRDDKGNYKAQQVKVEPEEAAPPTSVEELIRTEKGQKVYLDLLMDTFNTMAKIAADQLKVRNAAITKKNADEGTNTPLEAAEAINIDDVVARTREILGSLFPAPPPPEPAPVASIEDFDEATIRRAATRRQIDTVGLSIEEIKAALTAAPTVP